MSAAIAMAPSPAPHDRPAYADLAPATTASAPPAVAVAPAPTSSPAVSRTSAAPPPPPPNAHASHTTPSQRRDGSGSPRSGQPAKSSPPSATRHPPNSAAPKIFVKKEPGSPVLPTTRHRPRKLDLSKGGLAGSGAKTALLPGERDGLGIQEVGLACLSPGFVTQDPIMKEQLQRSMNVREQQRQIIEARLQQQSAKGDGPDMGKDRDNLGSAFAAKTPGMSRRNKAPPGLSIVAPSHEQFANERVIQSAPLGQTFTGRHNPHPLTRHIANQPSNLSSTSHIHHVPAQQTANRLPPIADVFGSGINHPESGRAVYPSSSHGPPASPGHGPQQSQPPLSSRPREYRSAEEAQHELAGGRAELLPKIVHYTGHQPPTPPSPRTGVPMTEHSRSASKRRRADYEEGGSPPLGNGPAATRRAGPFGAGRDSPETQKAKREEFLRICERAWDLFHS